MSDNEPHEFQLEEGDPSVPSDLLSLYVDLEDVGMTPEEFKELYG